MSSAPGVPKWNLPGTSREDLFAWEQRADDDDVDSARAHSGSPVSDAGHFAVQEHIQALVRRDPSDVRRIISPDEDQDEAVWIVEHLRVFICELGGLLVLLGDVCDSETCPKMIATTDWEFRCAAHSKPKDCCAIDYSTHTLSAFAALLNSESFASRLRVSKKSTQKFDSITRRLYRVFAHAYFHHPAVFKEFEERSFLCARFLAFSRAFELMTDSHFKPVIVL